MEAAPPNLFYQVRQLIEADQFTEALSVLQSSELLSNDKEFQRTSTALQARIINLTLQNQNDTITGKAYEVEKNKIVNSLLNLINRLEEQGFPSEVAGVEFEQSYEQSYAGSAPEVEQAPPIRLRPGKSIRTWAISLWSWFRKTPFGRWILRLFSWEHIFTTLGVGLISIGSFLLIWDQIQVDNSATEPTSTRSGEGREIPPAASEESLPSLPILDLNQGTTVNTELAGQAKLPAPSTGFRLPNSLFDQAETLGQVFAQLEGLARTAGAQQTFNFRLRRTVAANAESQQNQESSNSTGIPIAPPGIALTTDAINLAAQARNRTVDLEGLGEGVFITLAFVVALEDTYQTEPRPDLQPSFFQYKAPANYPPYVDILSQPFTNEYVIDCLLYQFEQQGTEYRWTTIGKIGFSEIVRALGLAERIQTPGRPPTTTRF